MESSSLLPDSTQLDQSWRRASGSGIQAPVDGVEEQVGQREGQARVRVDHVAVAHQQIPALPQRPLPAEAGSFHGADLRVLGRSGEGFGGQGRRHARERGQLDVVVVEAAVEGHGLAGVEAGRDLERQRGYSEVTLEVTPCPLQSVYTVFYCLYTPTLLQFPFMHVYSSSDEMWDIRYNSDGV